MKLDIRRGWKGKKSKRSGRKKLVQNQSAQKIFSANQNKTTQNRYGQIWAVKKDKIAQPFPLQKSNGRSLRNARTGNETE